MIQPTPGNMFAIVSVAVEIKGGSNFRDVEARLRETIFAEPDMPEVRGVLTQFITWDTPTAEDWWSRVAKKGGA